MDKKTRLLSLDVLRGFDMLMIMGFAGVVTGLCQVAGCGTDCWLARQFEHVEWNGLRFEDTIFPLFLFLAGVSWPFSLDSQRRRGLPARAIVLRCVRRAAVLFLLGLICGGLLQGTVRMGSVLGRIGIAWMVAAVLYMTTGWKTRLALALAIPIGYWLLMLFVPAPDALTLAVPEKLSYVREFGTGPFSIVGNLSGWLDRTIRPGVLCPYTGIADNQSILGTVPAVATALFGMLAGDLVRQPRTRLPDGRRLVVLMASAVALVALGLVVATGFGEASMPVNKKLWSASFTFIVAGYSFFMLGLFHWVVDVRGFTRWTLFFRVIGMNSITIYMASNVLPFMEVNQKLFGWSAGHLPTDWASLVLSATYVGLCWFFLYFLYRKDVFLRV